MKTISIDFFRIASAGGESFQSLLQTAFDLPEDESRTREIHGRHIRLQQLTRGNNHWAGDLVRIRMDAVPPKVSLDGRIESIDLEDDQGIGEESAFVYVPSINVLMLQRNRMGVLLPTLCRYFENIAGLDEPIEVDVVAEPEAMTRFEQLREIRRFELSVAGFDAGTYVNQEASTSDVLRTLATLHAPSIQLTCSMGREEGALSLQALRNLIRKLLRLNADGTCQVSKIRVSGNEDEMDPQEVIDLIQDRMVEVADVQQDAQRRVAYGSRIEAIESAWRTRRAQLIRMFRRDQ